MGTPYRVPRESSRWPSLGLALAMHLGLLFFLWIGIRWQNTEPVAVEAEVWDLKVQTAAPPPEVTTDPEPTPAPTPPPEPEVEQLAPPPPPPVAAPEPKVDLREAEIALERKKAKLKEEKAKAAAEERRKEEAKEREEEKRELEKQKQKEKDKAEKLEKEKEKEKADKLEKAKKEKADKEKAEKAEKAAEEKAEKEAAEKKAAAAEKAAKAKKAADEKKAADKVRAEQMNRMMAQAGSGSTGTAEKATAPRKDSGYVAALTSKIKGNIAYSGSTDVPGNPRAVFKIEQLPTGEIISVRKIKSSGLPAYDSSVENAINKSSPLPKKKDGSVEREIELIFEMKE